jgi:hypothetical protein
VRWAVNTAWKAASREPRASGARHEVANKRRRSALRSAQSASSGAVLGLILIAVGIIGIATDDIRTGYAIVILIVGLINLVRTMSPRNGD